MGILARSKWQSLLPSLLLMMQNQFFPIVFRTLTELCTPPSPVPEGCTESLVDCMEGTASGHLKRAISTPHLPQKHRLSHPSVPPPLQLTCQFRYPAGSITFPPRKICLVLLSYLQNTMHREELHLLPPWPGKSHATASCSGAGLQLLPAPLVIIMCQSQAGKHQLRS